ncbi:MAG: exodeoxyribonuclease III [Synergistaceae bacterium]
MTQLKIATFNVNSVKSRLPILDTWLTTEEAPDILCLQETKCQDHDFPAEHFETLGYKCYYKGMKSYNGVAIITKIEPTEIEFGLTDDKATPEKEESEKARVIRIKIGNLNIYNTYIPQGKAIDNPDYPYKLDFFARFKQMIDKQNTPQGKLLWVGDLNIAPTDIDVTNPKTKKDHACFHIDVKNAFTDVMSWGLTDIFRQHRPQEGEFTFWDYRVKNSLERNIGWRIDHIIGTEKVATHCTKVEVKRDLRAMERPSDHTAVVVYIDKEITK